MPSSRWLLALCVLEALVIVGLAWALLIAPRANTEHAEPSPSIDAKSADHVPPESPAPGVTRSAETVEATPTSVAREPRFALPHEDPVGILLYGSVRDASGKPIGGGTVRVFGENGAALYGSVSDREGQLGAYAIPGLTQGRWRVELKVKHYRESQQTIELAVAPCRLDFVVERAVLLKVKATTPDGTPRRSRSQSGTSR